MSDVGKFGIKGNTGLGIDGNFHVSLPYDCNGKAFVRLHDAEWGETWVRVPLGEADPDSIIRCYMCDNPAVCLDHLWPYYAEMNRCEDHLSIPLSDNSNILQKA